MDDEIHVVDAAESFVGGNAVYRFRYKNYMSLNFGKIVGKA